MSKVLGIIAEYNPFHNGHLYHLEESKRIAKAEYCIAVIGGNFTQRGEPSLIDKWSKAKSALLSGVDLVLELPVLYATSSAENFADGAIRLLDSLGVVDDLSFGCETADINFLDEIAEVLYKEPKEFKAILANELKSGISYPKARENALMSYLIKLSRYPNILSSPNNILAIEYIKALKKSKSIINPIALERNTASHDDASLTDNVSSATAIRNAINEGALDSVKNMMPKGSYKIIKNAFNHGKTLYGLHVFEKEIIYTLRKMSVGEISQLQDVSEGLENLIKKASDSCNSLGDLLNAVVSKRYTQTRIQRILLYSLLNITKKDISMSKKTAPYARILGYNERGKYLISEIVRVNPKLEFVASVKKFTDECPNKSLLAMLQKDILATNIYTLGYLQDSKSNLDFTKKIISI